MRAVLSACARHRRRRCCCIPLTLLALCAAAAALLALHPTHPHAHYLRIALGFLGLGWCHPVTVPRLHHAFPPTGGNAPFPGEAAFFSHLPCNRSAYRLYPPTAAAPAPPLCHPHATLIVTAFFDIGRARWPFLARDTPAYLAQAHAATLALLNPMVIATSPDLAPVLLAARAARGLADRTLILAHDVHCGAGMGANLPAAAAAMCAPAAMAALWRASPYLAVPERQQPHYNALMWMKAGLVAAAAALPMAALAAPGSVTWLDFGCHSPMCAAAGGAATSSGECLAPRAALRPGRLRLAQTAEVLEGGGAALAAGPVAWVRSHRVLLAGTIFGARREDAGALMQTFDATLQGLLAQGVADTDQTVLAWMMLQHPELFDAYSVQGDWHRIVRDF